MEVRYLVVLISVHERKFVVKICLPALGQGKLIRGNTGLYTPNTRLTANSLHVN